MLSVDAPRVRHHVLVILRLVEASHGFRIAKACVKMARVFIAPLLDPCIQLRLAAAKLIAEAEQAERGMVPVGVEDAVQLRTVECVPVRNASRRANEDGPRR